MAEQNAVELDDLLFADEERLRHEIKYLRERLVNLGVFKKMFFTLQEDLVAERQKSSELEQSLLVGDASEPGSEAAVTEVENIDQLKNELKNATDMAMLSMTTASEYGTVMDFFKDSGNAENYQDLVMLLFQAIGSYGLEASLQIRSYDGELNYFQNEASRDEDIALIQRFKVQGRILQREGFVCINYRNISLLVKKMPFDDEDKSGRYKDYLVVMCAGADVRIDALEASMKLERQQQGMYKIIRGAQQSMSDIEKNLGQQIRKVDKVYNEMAQDVGMAVNKLDLSFDQRKKLQAVVALNKKKLSKVLVDALGLDEDIVELIAILERTISTSRLNSEMEN